VCHGGDAHQRAPRRHARTLADEAIALDCPLSIIAGLALVYPKALFDYIGIARLWRCG